MQCPACQTEARKFGKDRYGNQRYQCLACRKTFSGRPANLLGIMRIGMDKALSVLTLLVEGMSIRATMRASGTDRGTILDLVALMGERCANLLTNRINKLTVENVQIDEVCGF